MLKQVLDFTRQVVALVRTTREHDDDIKKLEHTLKEHDGRLDRLTKMVRALAFEVKRDRELAARDREILLLRLQNALLLSGRELPPGPPVDKDDDDAPPP